MALITSHAVGAQGSCLGSRTCIAFVGDTGAGECLGSLEEFQPQGFPISGNLVTTTSQPMEKAGTQTVGFWAEELQRLSNIYLVPQCPLALSIGKLCEEGFTFSWHGSNLPMLIPPTTDFHHSIQGPMIEADRIDHHVPIFRFHVDVVHGMPASFHASSRGMVMVLMDLTWIRNPKRHQEPKSSWMICPQTITSRICPNPRNDLSKRKTL